MDAAVGGDVSDPLQLTSLPPLFLDLAASGYGVLATADRNGMIEFWNLATPPNHWAAHQAHHGGQRPERPSLQP
jgi:hypothetical protein